MVIGAVLRTVHRWGHFGFVTEVFRGLRDIAFGALLFAVAVLPALLAARVITYTAVPRRLDDTKVGLVIRFVVTCSIALPSFLAYMTWIAPMQDWVRAWPVPIIGALFGVVIDRSWRKGGA
jgi:hypothetical protein